VKLAGVVGPGALAPVAEAAGFQQQQVQQRPLVGLGFGDGRIPRHQGIKVLVELGAEAVDRLKHIGVALHPAQIVGPGGARH